MMTVTTSPSRTLRTLVFPSTPKPQYPELADPRFSPSTHPVAICFSGGGPRSFAASIGQMRAFRSLPLYNLVGAISVVSGGSWFGSLFTFANPVIPDSDLLGPTMKPGDLTLSNIASVPHNCIGFGLTQANNKRIFDSIAGSLLSGVPSNRLYARILNSVYCGPFDIDDVNKFFSLDAASVAAVIANNSPGLTVDDFYVVRPNRPYLVAGATQIFPTDEHLVMRHFEYSPLYDGTEQLFPAGSLPNGYSFGGGFLQTFAMDSSAPQKPNAQGLITVDAPLHRFTISDMMGSSGAAPGSILDKLGLPSLFAEFHYWPPQNAGATPDPTVQKLSIVDGGDLENTGIVAMLRRQYPVVICCVNTSTPLNPDWKTNPTKGTYEGVDAQISGLFGFMASTTTASREIRERAVEMMAGPAPVAMMQMSAELQTPEAMRFSIPQQNIQVFPQSEWPAVQQGLMQALAGGGPVWTATEHTIQPGNPFGIPPYPGNGKVTVIWLYNQKIAQWVSALQPEVRHLLSSTNKRNYMANFPNYETVFQNKDLIGIPELLLLTPQQVNLLGDMWWWAVNEIAGEIQKIVDKR
jgi:hypothetical protein